MTYKVLLHPKANESLEDFEEQTRERIKDKLDELKTKPRKGKKLKGFGDIGYLALRMFLAFKR